MITKEAMINGLLSYIDAEVIPCLSTVGKIAAGTMVYLASTNMNNLANYICSNQLFRALNVVNENGLIDANKLLTGMEQSFQKYGKAEFTIPVIGTLTFSSEDVSRLRTYMNRSNNVT